MLLREAAVKSIQGNTFALRGQKQEKKKKKKDLKSLKNYNSKQVSKIMLVYFSKTNSFKTDLYAVF